MNTSFWISLATTIVTAVFAIKIFNRYWQKRSKHLLAWGIGLALYCIGTAAQTLLSTTFNVFNFKLWYWSGALAVAPWLGQGTVFLLVRKKNWAWISFWIVLTLSLIGLPIIFGSSVDPAAYQPGIDLSNQFQEIFATTGNAKTLRVVLVIFMNSYGTLLLVGGAIYSAWIFWRKRILPQRMWGNVLIAFGGLLPAMGGVLILLGSPAFKYLGQLLGGILLFVGFLVAIQNPLKEQVNLKD